MEAVVVHVVVIKIYIYGSNEFHNDYVDQHIHFPTKLKERMWATFDED